MTSQKPRIVAVIQARMGSSRLPGKVLLPLAGAPLIERLIERVKRSKMLDEVVVATSTTAADEQIAELCRQIGARCYRGSEHDVLARVVEAATECQANVAVRLTGDNPFVDGSLIDLIVSQFLQTIPRPDYAHNADNSGFPFGLFVEAIRMEALHEAFCDGYEPADREHVTWYIRRRADRFQHLKVSTTQCFSESSVTIDTLEDYLRLRPVFERLFALDSNFSYLGLVKPE